MASPVFEVNRILTHIESAGERTVPRFRMRPVMALVTLIAASGLAHAAAPAASSPHAAPAASSAGKQTKAAAKPQAPVKMVDLNNASKAQLKTLSGVGDAEADRIIEKRPYSSKADIVTKAGIPAGVYVSNKRSIFVGKITPSKAAASPSKKASP